MTNRKQYVTINGKKLYLDEDGKPVTARGVHLHTDLIAVLDLEVETEAPAFEDIEPGVYGADTAPGDRSNLPVEECYVIYKKFPDGWEISGDPEAEPRLDLLKMWHASGELFRLHKHEATNA